MKCAEYCSVCACTGVTSCDQTVFHSFWGSCRAWEGGDETRSSIILSVNKKQKKIYIIPIWTHIYSHKIILTKVICTSIYRIQWIYLEINGIYIVSGDCIMSWSRTNFFEIIAEHKMRILIEKTRFFIFWDDHFFFNKCVSVFTLFLNTEENSLYFLTWKFMYVPRYVGDLIIQIFLFHSCILL